jgi:hypothetical protein
MRKSAIVVLATLGLLAAGGAEAPSAKSAVRSRDPIRVRGLSTSV